MSTTNNNPFTEIAAIVLAALLIIAGGLLLYTARIDFTQATVIFGLAVTIYGGNLALKAPSPTQQAQIAAIATQQSSTISQMVSQQAVPAQASEPAPGQRFTTPVPQAGGAYVPPPAQFIPQPITPTPAAQQFIAPLTTNTTATVPPPVYQPFSTMPNMQVPQ